MHEHIPDTDEPLHELIFDQVSDPMPLINGKLCVNLDVDIHEIFEAGFSYPEFLNLLNARNFQGGTSNPLDECRIGLWIEEFARARPKQLDTSPEYGRHDE